MDEREAIAYATAHGVTVTVDSMEPRTKQVSFKVGDYTLYRHGKCWRIGKTAVYVHHRGNAIRYVVDLIRHTKGKSY